MRSIATIFFLFPFVMFAQYKRTVFVEGGVSQNQSFNPDETVYSPIYIYGWCGTGLNDFSQAGTRVSKIHRETTFSPLVRIGIEVVSSKEKTFKMSCPMAFGYMESRQHYKTTVQENYNTGYQNNFTYETRQISKFVSIIIGPKANLEFRKVQFFTAANLNTDIRYFYRETVTDYKPTGWNPGIAGLTMNNDVFFNVSIQNGLIYKLSSQFSAGLTFETVIYSIDPNTIRYDKANNHLFNLGYGDHSSAINTGIRFQYSF